MAVKASLSYQETHAVKSEELSCGHILVFGNRAYHKAVWLTAATKGPKMEIESHPHEAIHTPRVSGEQL